MNLYFSVSLHGRMIIEPSPLGLYMKGEDGDFVHDLQIVSKDDRVIYESFSMPSGKKCRHENLANEMTLAFRNTAGQTMEIVVRACNDGMAYRYRFPGEGQTRSVTREVSGFKIPLDSTAWIMPWIKHYRNGGFQHWCDEPDSYRAIPAAVSYLRKVPAAWDDTKFIDGYPGEYVCLARRKADDWFLAGIAAGDERTVPIPLSFLAPGKMYQLTLHTDGRGKDDIVTKKTEATRQTTLTIKMNEDGGFCGHLTP
jgi:hypothetical protein